MEWTKENTLLLLKQIRERPVIWDATLEEHKNRQKRLDALSEIAKNFNLTKDEIHSKWMTLRGQYSREKRRMTEPKKGKDPDALYVSKWFAYQEMTDLMACNSPQHSISNSTFSINIEGWNQDLTMEWTKENTLLLLKLIRERPVIWDATVEEHKNKQKRLDALSEIATILNLTKHEIYTKWMSLRGQYIREKRKMAEPKKGRESDPLYVSKWFAYQEMTDLMACNSPQHSISNSTPQNSNDQFPESFLAQNFIASDHQYESTDTQDTPSNKRKRSISDEKSNDGVPNDEFEVYARYVASELRHTGDPHSVLMAKHHINNILFNARMGKYRDSSTDTQEVAAVEGCVKI